MWRNCKYAQRMKRIACKLHQQLSKALLRVESTPASRAPCVPCAVGLVQIGVEFNVDASTPLPFLTASAGGGSHAPTHCSKASPTPTLGPLPSHASGCQLGLQQKAAIMSTIDYLPRSAQTVAPVPIRSGRTGQPPQVQPATRGGSSDPSLQSPVRACNYLQVWPSQPPNATAFQASSTYRKVFRVQPAGGLSLLPQESLSNYLAGNLGWFGKPSQVAIRP